MSASVFANRTNAQDSPKAKGDARMPMVAGSMSPNVTFKTPLPFTWLSAFVWRLAKFWRGLRSEIPWVDRSPAEIVRDHVRLTLQPIDAPPQAEQLERVWEHLGSDEMLLFSTDYPHWQFDDTPLPDAVPAAIARKILIDNPLATYPRLMEAMP